MDRMTAPEIAVLLTQAIAREWLGEQRRHRADGESYYHALVDADTGAVLAEIDDS